MDTLGKNIVKVIMVGMVLIVLFSTQAAPIMTIIWNYCYQIANM